MLKHFLIGCFCLSLAWFTARIVVHFLTPPSLPDYYFPAGGKKRPVASSGEGKETSAVSADAVLRRNLFHVAIEKPQAIDTQAGEKAMSEAEEAQMREEMGKLPISRQGWTLLGTIVNTIAPAQSKAILLVNGKQKAYAPGESLKDWKIAHIDRRTVIVEKNGRRERMLVGGKDIAPPPSSRPVAVRKSISAGEIEKVMSNLPGLLDQVGLAATQQNGVYGLNVTFLKPDSFMSRLGLRQNDILTQANGKNLSDMGDLSVLGNLSSQNSLRLELIRNGQNIVLEYDINR